MPEHEEVLANNARNVQMASRILVTIPAYNEEMTVGKVVEAVRKLYPEFDIVVIDDGSTDKTSYEAKNAGAGLITLPFHAGGTSAVLTGYLAALMLGYDYLVKLDGDGQHRPEDLELVLEPVMTKEADICVGSRYLRNSTRTEEDSAVKIGGRVFSSVLVDSLLKDFKITDITSGLRAWNRRALQVLVRTHLGGRFPDDSVLWLSETMIAGKKGLRIKEIPVEILPRIFGKSKSFSPRKMLVYPMRLISLLITGAS